MAKKKKNAKPAVAETTITETAAVPEAAPSRPANDFDIEATVDLRGSDPVLPTLLRDDATDEPAVESAADPETQPQTTSEEVSKTHLRGLVEALVFAADHPLKTAEIAKLASAPSRQIKEILDELRLEYVDRGVQLDEIAGGWAFRTNVQYAPFVRDLTGLKPVKLSRAQLETLAIVAYRQPVTRPEVDDIRGVDCGAVLKTLLERDLVRILGKKDEPGRPILYGTSHGFLELFSLKSLKDLPTLREFTELNEDSRRVVESELGEVLEQRQTDAGFEEPPPVDDLGDRPTLESITNDDAPADAETPETEDTEATDDEPAKTSSYDPADELEFPDDEDDDDEDDEDDEEDDEDDEDDEE